MGRTTEDPRRTTVSVRLTDGEVKALRALCAARRWSMSRALREVLSEGVRRVVREVGAERRG